MRRSFLFITGLLRSLEKRCLSEEMIRSLMERPDPENTREVLRASYFREWVPEGSSGINLDSFLHMSREWVLQLASSFEGDDLAALFRLPRDYHNIKTVLRGIIFEQNQTGLLSREGTLSAGIMRTYLEEKNYEEMPGLMKQATLDALSVYGDTKSILRMDLCLDAGLVRDLLQKTHKLKSPMVLSHQRLAVDLANACIFMRVGDLRNDETVSSGLYIEGGYFDAGYFRKCQNETELAKLLERSDKHAMLGRGVREYASNSFALEREGDRFLLNALEEAAYLIDGPEPLYAFLCRVDWEIRVLGMILSAGNAGGKYIRMRLEGVV